MRKRLPLVIATGGIICIIVAAALVGNHVFGGVFGGGAGEAKSAISLRSAAEALASKTLGQSRSPRSCFWSRGKRRWCIDQYESTEYEDYWTNDDGYNEPWHIARYGRNYTVTDHNDEVLGYLRSTTRGGWRAHVFVCLDNPPKAWARQGCGFVRDGKAVPAGRNVFRVYTKGRMVGIARGPAAGAVVAHKLIGGGIV